MEPITGFMLYAACAAIVAAVAGKKGLRLWVYLLAVLVLGPVTVMATSIATQGTASGFVAASLAFMVPLVALVISFFSKNDTEIATDNGQYGDYKKCPYCAETIRLEAIKCKHCGSSLAVTSAADGMPSAGQ